MLLFMMCIPETKHTALVDHFPEKRSRYFPTSNGQPLLTKSALEMPPKNNSAAGLVDDL